MILRSDARVLRLVSPQLTVHFKEESLVSICLFKTISTDFWPLWVFVLRLSPAAAGRAFSSCGGTGFLQQRRADSSLPWLPFLWSAGSGRAGSVAVARGLCHPEARGTFPDQGWNLCPLRWQVDS